MKYKIVPVTHYAQNCSLIICEKTAKGALIDPGGEVEKLLQCVKQENIQLEKILLTHGHFDHVGGAKEIALRLNIPIIGPAVEDKFWIDRLPEDGRLTGFGELQSFTPTQWLSDGDLVTVGELVLSVLCCPGHTPGHVVFINEANQLAFVGDVLFKDSIGRTDFPMGDHETLISSIKNKLIPLGDDITFVPGHGPTSTFGRERLYNPFIAE